MTDTDTDHSSASDERAQAASAAEAPLDKGGDKDHPDDLDHDLDNDLESDPDDGVESDPDDDVESGLDDGMSEDEYKKTVSQLVKVGLSPSFTHDVEETIRQRSGGRFFGRKAFGERVPYEILALVILAIGLIAFLVLRSSTTGSLRYEQNQNPPQMAPGAKDVVPQPKQLEER